MELSDYPRPPDDTGIGIHWSAGNPAAVGIGELRDYWIPQLHSLGVKWVKFLHDGGLEFAALLQQSGIMPVVRLYRYQPNSTDSSPGRGTLGPSEIQYLERYIDAGVRYFEFNNEPGLPAEWEDGVLPPNGETIVARNAIVDMETILVRGGFPALPATAIGSKWDLIGKIVQLGRADLFDEPVWIAVHNYDINHPLDYPYDVVNQEGQQLSPAEYQELDRQGAWYGKNWGHRSLEFINEQRSLGANPGDTIHDDPSCWLSYTRFDELVDVHLGRALPILATENGPIVDEDPDPRYPSTTPDWHKDKVLEMCRIMMGTSELHEPAPPQYFCTAFWLIGGTVLLDGWESHAWYSPTRPGGRLPVVDALKVLPKQTRTEQGDWQEGVIEGWVRNGAGYTLLLDGPVSGFSEIGQDEGFHFDELRAGTYALMVRGTELSVEVALFKGQEPCVVELELTQDHISPPRESVLRGSVLGGAGHLLVLSGAVDRMLTIGDAETYRFDRLPEGTYSLALDGTGVQHEGITLDGRSETVVDLQLSGGWIWDQWDGGPGPGFGVVRCSVEGMMGLPVHLWTDGWAGITQLSGSKPEYGPYACEFAPLGGGHYYVEPEGLGVRVQISIDGRRVLWVGFREQSAPIYTSSESIIRGKALGGLKYAVELRRGHAYRREVSVATDGAYLIEGIPAGTYSMRLLRVTRQELGPDQWIESKSAVPGLTLEEVQLDGQNKLVVDFDARRLDPCRGAGVLEGVVHGGDGQTVTLVWPGGFRSETAVGEDDHFRFEWLGDGTYELLMEDVGIKQTCQLSSDQAASLELWLPDAHKGVVWGRVRDGAGQQIELAWTSGRQESTIASNGIYRFSGLPKGVYDLRVPNSPAQQTGIQLEADQTVEVNLEVPPPKTLEHYVLLGGILTDWNALLATMRYAARFAPALGKDLDIARRARHVTIIGGENVVSTEDEQMLAGTGCLVRRISRNIAPELDRLVSEGQPY